MNWFSKGTEQVEREAKIQKEARENRPPKRLWMEQNSEKHIIYLDDEGFNFYEHAVTIPGRKVPEFITCAGRDNCLACQVGVRSHLITMYTIVDLTGYTNNKGEKIEKEKCIHALKSESALALARKSERWGGLKGLRVIVSRKGQKDANAGSDFEPAMKDGTMVRYQLNWTEPKYFAFDYTKFFAPKSKDDVAALLRMAGYDVSRFADKGRSGFDANASGGIEIPDVGMDAGSKSSISADDDTPF